MTIKVGDKVRVEFEGEVDALPEFGVNTIQIEFVVDGERSWVDIPVALVEKITPPMPTASGSVLRLFPTVNNRLYIKSDFPDVWNVIQKGDFKGKQSTDDVYELWAAGQLEVVLDSQS